MDELRDACRAWQGRMEGGSSPIRAAARNLTGVKHYFDAPFIRDYEAAARASDVTTRRAVVLLAALAESPLRTATEWGDALGTGSVWVGRGIKKGADDQDRQIQASLRAGELTMPLWGTQPRPCHRRELRRQVHLRNGGTLPGHSSVDSLWDQRPGGRVDLRGTLPDR